MRSPQTSARYLLAALAFASFGCGANTALPTPEATPYTEPTTLAFVHILGGGQLATYTVGPANGLLSRTHVVDVPGSNHFLAATPEGRFVLVDFLPSGESQPLLRRYAVQPAGGTVDLADQQYSPPPADLAATDGVVFVSYSAPGAHDPYLRMACFSLGAGGFLETKPVSYDPALGDSPWGLDFGGLLATAAGNPSLYRTTQDGQGVRGFLVQARKWEVRLGPEVGRRIPSKQPAVSAEVVAGDVLVVASSGGSLTTFEPEWAAQRLETRASVQAAGPLLAYAAGVLAVASADGRVEIYAIGAHGMPTLKKSTRLSLAPVVSLGFHPSGRFLYVSGSTLATYLVEADGSLRPYSETTATPGRLVVTLPPAP